MAQECAQGLNKVALERHNLQRAKEPEQEHDEHGNVICIDCASIILIERLAAKTNAARCFDCQDIKERERRLWTN